MREKNKNTMDCEKARNIDIVSALARLRHFHNQETEKGLRYYSKRSSKAFFHL